MNFYTQGLQSWNILIIPSQQLISVGICDSLYSFDNESWTYNFQVKFPILVYVM